MKRSMFLILFIALNVLAQDETQFFVNTLDEDIDTSSIESKQVHVQKGVGPVRSRSTPLPDPKEMEKLFQSAGLTADIKKMDQLDQDLFFRKVQNRKLEEVQKSYPSIAPEKIAKLMNYFFFRDFHF